MPSRQFVPLLLTLFWALTYQSQADHVTYTRSLLQPAAAAVGGSSPPPADTSPPSAAAPTPAPEPSPDAPPTPSTILQQGAHLVNFTTEFSFNGSLISVAESMAANVLAVQFRFNSCSGAQIHHHSGTEVMQATDGVIQIGCISPGNTFTLYNLTVGQMIVIPDGWLHYYLNLSCEPAVMIATWPAGTKTMFDLSLLSAMPSGVFTGVFSAGPAPAVKAGFPIVFDPGCMKRCGLSAASAPSAGN